MPPKWDHTKIEKIRVFIIMIVSINITWPKRAILIASLAFGFSSQVLATHKVYSPQVEKGEWAAEVRGHASFDEDDSKDDEQAHRLELEYGITDYWKTAFFGDFQQEPMGSLKYTATGWENIFYILKESEHGLGAGLYLEYKDSHRGGTADDIEIKLLLEKQIAHFLNTVNLNFEKGVGSAADEGVEFAYAWRTGWMFNPMAHVGFEAFGEIGEVHAAPDLSEQEHQLGPVMYGKFKFDGIGKFKYRLGWLFGLTEETPDHALKWELEYELPF